MPADAVARLRLIRTDSIGPITYRQLIARFGDAESAIRGLPDLARKGGRSLVVAGVAAAEAELAALAAIVQRAEPNVSRTLSKLVNAGFVTLHEGKGKAKVPQVKIHRVTIEIDTLHWADHIMTA